MTDEELGQTLVNIATINHKLADPKFLERLNGDQLTYTGVKLAAMKASILDLKVAAHSDMLEKEVIMMKAKAQAYAKSKDELAPNGKPHGATAAKDMKYMDEEFIKATREYNKAVVSFEQLRGVISNTHDTIESIKGRAIDMQSARKDERLG